MKTLAERLKEAREKRDVSQSELVRRIGVKPQAIQYIEAGKAQTSALILKISKVLNVDPFWLEDGGEFKDLSAMGTDFILVPRYDVTVSMGGGAPVHSEQVVDFLSFKKDWIEKEHFKPENLALIDSRGDSMSPTLNPGDLLLIDHSPIDRLANGIYVINIDGDLLAKRVERQLDGSIRIISDNPKYPPQVITDEDSKKLIVVGRVVWAGGRM